MTTNELRKEASKLGIKNYTKYAKEELIVLIDQAKKENQSEEIEEIQEIQRVSLLPAIIYQDLAMKVEEPKKRKGRSISYDIPRDGSQAYKIYKYFEKHYMDKNCTIYKCCKVLGTPSHNTKRIFDKFFKQKRLDWLANQEEKIEYVQEEDMN